MFRYYFIKICQDELWLVYYDFLFLIVEILLKMICCSWCMMLLIGIGPWQGCEPPRIYGRGNMARACKSKILGMGTWVYQAVLGTSKLKVSSIIGFSSLPFLKFLYVLLMVWHDICFFFLMKSIQLPNVFFVCIAYCAYMLQ